MESVVAFEITMDEKLVAQEDLAWRHQCSGRYFKTTLKVVLGIFVAGLAVLGVVVRAAEVIVPALTLLVLLFVAPWLDRLLTTRRARKSPRFGDSTRIEISDAGLYESGFSNEGTVAWTAFTVARRTPSGIMLYLGPDAFKWLPFDSLVAGTREDAESIVRRNVSEYRNG